MAEIAAPVKETKAQRIERLKREKNPWEAFDEVRAFAREGRSSVAPEWASAYFKCGGSTPRATAWALSVVRTGKGMPPNIS
jgi:sulfite reductase (ferredoxin)